MTLLCVSVTGALVFCGLIAALIASFKGRSSIAFFVWGCAVIGIILIACLPNRRTAAWRPMHEFVLAIQFATLAGLCAVAIAAFHVVVTYDMRPPSPSVKSPSMVAPIEPPARGMQFTVIPKDHLTFRETWVDIRHWTAIDEFAHPAVAKRIRAYDETLMDRVRKASTQPAPTPVSAAPQPTPRVAIPQPQPQPQKQLPPAPPPKYEPNIFDDMEKDKK